MKPLDMSWLQLGVLIAISGIAAGAFITGDTELAKDLGFGLLGALALHPKQPGPNGPN